MTHAVLRHSSDGRVRCVQDTANGMTSNKYAYEYTGKVSFITSCTKIVRERDKWIFVDNVFCAHIFLAMQTSRGTQIHVIYRSVERRNEMCRASKKYGCGDRYAIVRTEEFDIFETLYTR